MESFDLTHKIRQYLSANYFFVVPKIYSVFNKEDVIFFLHKKDLYFQQNKDRLLKMSLIEFMLEKHVQDNWSRFDLKKHIEWFANEYRWIDGTDKKADVKRILSDIFKQGSEYSLTLSMTETLHSMASGKRLVCREGRATVNYDDRVAANVEPGDTIYFNEGSSNIVNPGFVIECHEDDRCRIMYFTNLSKDHIETSRIDINGWGFHNVSTKEIGTTPIMAKQNSYC